MGQVTNNWSLFGLDLTRAGKWLALGFRQLLYDRDAWLLRRFDPPVTLFSEGTESLYQADRLYEDIASGRTKRSAYRSDMGGYCAVALPQDEVLLKTLRLPVASEEDLESAMALEIDSSSPFSDQDTRAAWRVLSRGESVIEVVLAITARFVFGARQGRCTTLSPLCLFSRSVSGMIMTLRISIKIKALNDCVA